MKYLNGEEIPIEIIKETIRNILLVTPNQVCAVLVGSALKNKGIQPLLDAVIDYLPCPEDKPPMVSLLDEKNKRYPTKSDKLLAYAYKIINDKDKGSLVFLRVYSGKITHKSLLMNASRGMAEKPHHLFRVRANQYVSKNNIYIHIHKYLIYIFFFEM